MFGRITNFGKKKVVDYGNMIGRAGAELSGLRRIKYMAKQMDRGLWEMAFGANERVAANQEAFSAVVARYKLTEQDLEIRHRRFKWLARMYFVVTVAAITLGLIFDGILPFLTSIGLAAIPLSLWFRWSLRTWQVRNRYLGGVKEFMASPGWWSEAFR